MNMLHLLSCLFVRKGIIRFVALLLLSTLVLVGIGRPNRAYGNPSDLVELTVHNDTSGQTNYIVLTYKGGDGNTNQVFCQTVPPLNWVDVAQSASGSSLALATLEQRNSSDVPSTSGSIPALATPGQIMSLQYFHSPGCDPSSRFISVDLPLPAAPVFNHCWFNPDNTKTPNWSGCVSPSQTLPINFN